MICRTYEDELRAMKRTKIRYDDETWDMILPSRPDNTIIKWMVSRSR